MNKKLTLAFVFANLACASISPAQSIPAINVDASVFTEFVEGSMLNTSGIYGWSFVITEPVTVTGLGWVDKQPAGLFQEHEIKIWKDDIVRTNWPFFVGPGSVIDSLVIPKDTAAPLDTGYRRVDFEAALILAPGNYALLGTFEDPGGDPFVYLPADAFLGVTDSRLTLGAPTWAYGRDFEFGTIHHLLVSGAYLGPMLFVQPIPEPGCGQLLLLAGGAFLVFRRRLRRTVIRD